jgi:hypothetical protein
VLSSGSEDAGLPWLDVGLSYTTVSIFIVIYMMNRINLLRKNVNRAISSILSSEKSIL